MPDKVIIKPDITPEERLKRLNKVEAVISQITGYQCSNVPFVKELNRKNKTSRKHVNNNQ
ncbi:hypothetical protein [Ruminiclostridium cellulolyticum]|uniref:Uncharacterized protein n=1 Tax=Ruminiclostridium cellulolyticum (strain ATCC 35319 / DSM 5812 / JCM 6584 / H10) TaxID=394503 RepID=B8I452_RUMCH|nr:hypothetical protein [Ruminiclostridium cellulolyticum]ACL76485.1 hypothetical protein Ccel_2142 [Ruminiclostridium cellulolyticum H10]